SGAAGVTGYGVQVDRALSKTHVAMTMRDVIVERATTDAIVAHASDLTLERVVVRDTQARPKDHGQALGLLVSGDAATGRGNASLRSVVIVQSRMAGIVLSTGDATVEQSIVRDVTPDDLGRNGDGIIAEDAVLTLRSSLVERTVEAG